MSRTEMIDTTAELYLDSEVYSSDSTMRQKEIGESRERFYRNVVVSQVS